MATITTSSMGIDGIWGAYYGNALAAQLEQNLLTGQMMLRPGGIVMVPDRSDPFNMIASPPDLNVMQQEEVGMLPKELLEDLETFDASRAMKFIKGEPLQAEVSQHITDPIGVALEGRLRLQNAQFQGQLSQQMYNSSASAYSVYGLYDNRLGW